MGEALHEFVAGPIKMSGCQGAVRQEGIAHAQHKEEQTFLGLLLVVKALSKPDTVARCLTFIFTVCSFWLLLQSTGRKTLNNTDLNITE